MRNLEIKILTWDRYFNLCIPATLQYRYAVDCGMAKLVTVPIPALPISETPQVYPYPY